MRESFLCLIEIAAICITAVGRRLPKLDGVFTPKHICSDIVVPVQDVHRPGVWADPLASEFAGEEKISALMLVKEIGAVNCGYESGTIRCPLPVNDAQVAVCLDDGALSALKPDGQGGILGCNVVSFCIVGS